MEKKFDLSETEGIIKHKYGWEMNMKVEIGQSGENYENEEGKIFVVCAREKNGNAVMVLDYDEKFDLEWCNDVIFDPRFGTDKVIIEGEEASIEAYMIPEPCIKRRGLWQTFGFPFEKIKKNRKCENTLDGSKITMENGKMVVSGNAYEGKILETENGALFVCNSKTVVGSITNTRTKYRLGRQVDNETMLKHRCSEALKRINSWQETGMTEKYKRVVETSISIGKEDGNNFGFLNTRLSEGEMCNMLAINASEVRTEEYGYVLNSKEGTIKWIVSEGKYKLFIPCGVNEKNEDVMILNETQKEKYKKRIEENIFCRHIHGGLFHSGDVSSNLFLEESIRRMCYNPELQDIVILDGVTSQKGYSGRKFWKGNKICIVSGHVGKEQAVMVLGKGEGVHYDSDEGLKELIEEALASIDDREKFLIVVEKIKRYLGDEFGSKMLGEEYEFFRSKYFEIFHDQVDITDTHREINTIDPLKWKTVSLLNDRGIDISAENSWMNKEETITVLKIGGTSEGYCFCVSNFIYTCKHIVKEGKLEINYRGAVPSEIDETGTLYSLSLKQEISMPITKGDVVIYGVGAPGLVHAVVGRAYFTINPETCEHVSMICVAVEMKNKEYRYCVFKNVCVSGSGLTEMQDTNLPGWSGLPVVSAMGDVVGMWGTLQRVHDQDGDSRRVISTEVVSKSAPLTLPDGMVKELLFKTKKADGKWCRVIGGTGCGKSTKLALKIAEEGEYKKINVCVPTRKACDMLYSYMSSIIPKSQKVYVTKKHGEGSDCTREPKPGDIELKYITSGSCLNSITSGEQIEIRPDTLYIIDEQHIVNADSKALEEIFFSEGKSNMIAMTATPTDSCKYESIILPQRNSGYTLQEKKLLKKEEVGISIYKGQNIIGKLPESCRDGSNIVVILPTIKMCEDAAKHKIAGYNTGVVTSKHQVCFESGSVIYYCTNIIESSVTIPNLGHLVDSQLENRIEKELYLDKEIFSYIENPQIVACDSSSITQRKGRLSRVRDGVYWTINQPTDTPVVSNKECNMETAVLLRTLNTKINISKLTEGVARYYSMISPENISEFRNKAYKTRETISSVSRTFTAARTFKIQPMPFVVLRNGDRAWYSMEVAAKIGARYPNYLVEEYTDDAYTRVSLKSEQNVLSYSECLKNSLTDGSALGYLALSSAVIIGLAGHAYNNRHTRVCTTAHIFSKKMIKKYLATTNQVSEDNCDRSSNVSNLTGAVREFIVKHFPEGTLKNTESIVNVLDGILERAVEYMKKPWEVMSADLVKVCPLAAGLFSPEIFREFGSTFGALILAIFAATATVAINSPVGSILLGISGMLGVVRSVVSGSMTANKTVMSLLFGHILGIWFKNSKLVNISAPNVIVNNITTPVYGSCIGAGYAAGLAVIALVESGSSGKDKVALGLTCVGNLFVMAKNPMEWIKFCVTMTVHGVKHSIKKSLVQGAMIETAPLVKSGQSDRWADAIIARGEDLSDMFDYLEIAVLAVLSGVTNPASIIAATFSVVCEYYIGEINGREETKKALYKAMGTSPILLIPLTLYKVFGGVDSGITLSNCKNAGVTDYVKMGMDVILKIIKSGRQLVYEMTKLVMETIGASMAGGFWVALWEGIVKAYRDMFGKKKIKRDIIVKIPENLLEKVFSGHCVSKFSSWHYNRSYLLMDKSIVVDPGELYSGFKNKHLHSRRFSYYEATDAEWDMVADIVAAHEGRFKIKGSTGIQVILIKFRKVQGILLWLETGEILIIVQTEKGDFMVSNGISFQELLKQSKGARGEFSKDMEDLVSTFAKCKTVYFKNTRKIFRTNNQIYADWDKFQDIREVNLNNVGNSIKEYFEKLGSDTVNNGKIYYGIGFKYEGEKQVARVSRTGKDTVELDSIVKGEDEVGLTTIMALALPGRDSLSEAYVRSAIAKREYVVNGICRKDAIFGKPELEIEENNHYVDMESELVASLHYYNMLQCETRPDVELPLVIDVGTASWQEERSVNNVLESITFGMPSVLDEDNEEEKIMYSKTEGITPLDGTGPEYVTEEFEVRLPYGIDVKIDVSNWLARCSSPVVTGYCLQIGGSARYIKENYWSIMTIMMALSGMEYNLYAGKNEYKLIKPMELGAKSMSHGVISNIFERAKTIFGAKINTSSLGTGLQERKVIAKTEKSAIVKGKDSRIFKNGMQQNAGVFLILSAVFCCFYEKIKIVTNNIVPDSALQAMMNSISNIRKYDWEKIKLTNRVRLPNSTDYNVCSRGYFKAVNLFEKGKYGIVLDLTAGRGGFGEFLTKNRSVEKYIFNNKHIGTHARTIVDAMWTDSEQLKSNGDIRENSVVKKLPRCDTLILIIGKLHS